MGVLCSYPQLSQIKQTEISEFQKETLNKFFLKVQQTSKQVGFFPFLKKKRLYKWIVIFFFRGGGVNVDPIRGRQLVMLVFWRYVKNKTQARKRNSNSKGKQNWQSTNKQEKSEKQHPTNTQTKKRDGKQVTKTSEVKKHNRQGNKHRVYLYRQNSSSVECGPEDVCIHQST